MPKNDWPTVAALGLIAMCVVTVDHEALGHGSACLLLGGHIRLLTSSLFHCDAKSDWIDPAGPAMSILIGALAWLLRAVLPVRFAKLKLFLICVTAFSFFWEGGYLIQVMLKRDGDLYFFARFLLGNVTLWQRWIGGLAGLALFILSARIATRALLALWPQASVARSVARTVWLSATLGAAVAASAYTGHGWKNLHDAVLETGGASFLLLAIPLRAERLPQTQDVAIARDYKTVMLAALVFAAFVATLGRGVVVQ